MFLVVYCVFQACAPLYQWSTFGVSEREPVGTCYLKKGTQVAEYAPCRSSRFCCQREPSSLLGGNAAFSVQVPALQKVRGSARLASAPAS